MCVQIFKTIAAKMYEEFRNIKLLETGTCLENTAKLKGTQFLNKGEHLSQLGRFRTYIKPRLY